MSSQIGATYAPSLMYIKYGIQFSGLAFTSLEEGLNVIVHADLIQE